MTKVAKTLIIIEYKNGNESRVDSPQEIEALIDDLRAISREGYWGQALGFRDIDGSYVLFNTQEFTTVTLIPQEYDDATP